MNSRTRFTPDVRRVLLATLVALAVGTACMPGAPAATSAPTTAASTASSLGTVTFRLEGDWPHLDPTGRTPGGGLQQVVLTNLLYDSLVVIGPDPQDATKPKLLPYLASSWDQTPTQLTFHLRQGATCTDGSPVNASLVKRSVDQYLKSATNTAATFGAGPFDTTADDAAGTFTLNLGTPYADALYAFIELRIVCPKGLDDDSLLVSGSQGSGPYAIESAEHGNQIVLVRRDDWNWGPNGITAKDIPQKLIGKVVTNETTVANLLLTGGLDISRTGGTDVSRLQAEKSLVAKVGSSFYNNTLIFNQLPARPTSDPIVRQALASAVNLDAWNQAANQGNGVISPSFLQSKADCFDPTTQTLRVANPGPETAKAVLVAAGWTPGADGMLQKEGKPLTIQLVSTTINGLGNGGEYLVSQWQKAGITVQPTISGDYNTFIQALTQSNFDAFTTNYPFDQPNPNRALVTNIGPNNSSKSNQPEVEKEYAAAESSVGAERCQHWANVQQMLIKNYSLLPLASPQIFWFSRGIEFFPGASWSNPIFFRKAAGS
jgi:peptide/nickel transport system substrate-binding protein